ncbi:hypothetical protein AMATHDRAFT_87535 [Amanita thiersii Skay4041]|uniref:Enoyl reductase (ER) domain-containing protein n=1 Tax=Amanita thiersii Skay4041 TaxID=703135 RepID=A0A2A9NHI6_9AGAR|nr:hypothetical protein AMATHDRAFT_87535 [Amanita thiersii Skay4041]
MSMEAVCYNGPNDLQIIKTQIPQINDDQVLIKVSCCGICGTDHHLAVGEFLAKYPLIPGHEFVGKIVQLGRSVTGLSVGDRCVADNTILCDQCFYCRRGQPLLCENFESLGATTAGGFAEYVAVQGKKVYKIFNLTDEEATLVEPTSCAIHGMDKLGPAVGVEALILGCGPTGLILAQLLKLNGASRVVIASNKGIKTQIAQQLKAGDDVIELDRTNPAPQWAKLKQNNPYGFDVVVEATGSAQVAEDAINYVRRGGTLMIYGVYPESAKVTYSPFKIFSDEIKVIGSFAQTHCFPRAVAYLESGIIRVNGIVTDSFPIKDFKKALDQMNSRQSCKVILKIE